MVKPLALPRRPHRALCVSASGLSAQRRGKLTGKSGDVSGNHLRPGRVAALGRKLYFYDNGIAGVLARQSEGALFENAVFNQLRAYGDLAYLARGSAYEIDFVLGGPAPPAATALEVKTHPVPSDLQKLRRRAASHALPQAHLVGRFPTPGFNDFIWGGLIF